ncbi:hypothetical protein PWT90_10148 [Aphanocladium album]|nr:hypothetical protein PWT90_10148 [Aphanocladium album]
MDGEVMYRRKPMKTARAETDGSDASESEHEGLEPGVMVLHTNGMRKIVLESNNAVVNSGAHMDAAEAEALKTAGRAGIPAPRLHDVSSNNDIVEIRMSYITGQTLKQLWPSMPADRKENTANQLGLILQHMQALKPPRTAQCIL